MQYHYSVPSCIEYINLKVGWRILQFNSAETHAGFSAFLNHSIDWLKKCFHCFIKPKFVGDLKPVYSHGISKVQIV